MEFARRQITRAGGAGSCGIDSRSFARQGTEFPLAERFGAARDWLSDRSVDGLAGTGGSRVLSGHLSQQFVRLSADGSHAVHLIGGLLVMLYAASLRLLGKPLEDAPHCGGCNRLVLALHGFVVDLYFRSIVVCAITPMVKQETESMSDVAVHHHEAMADAYEPSLFGTYSKKIGMWLFLLSDSLTFGALLYAYTYGRVSTPELAYAVPLGKYPKCHHDDRVPADQLADHGVCGACGCPGNAKAQRLWLLATMACGMAFVILHGREWSNLIAEGLPFRSFRLPRDKPVRNSRSRQERPAVSQQRSSALPACTCCT